MREVGDRAMQSGACAGYQGRPVFYLLIGVDGDVRITLLVELQAHARGNRVGLVLFIHFLRKASGSKQRNHQHSRKQPAKPSLTHAYQSRNSEGDAECRTPQVTSQGNLGNRTFSDAEKLIVRRWLSTVVPHASGWHR